jgi:copper ion binding protein
VVSNALRLRAFRPKLRREDDGSTAEENSTREPGTTDREADEIALPSNEKGEDHMMTKKLKIEGMMCQHCVAHVNKALSGVEGVSDVAVSLEDKSAVVTLSAPVEDTVLTAAVVDAGYEVTGVEA